MLYIDLKYIGYISARLKQFTYKSSNSTGVIGCFIHSCERNDSRKKRGYFLNYKGGVFFKCFHCGESTNLGQFIKQLDPLLFDEYKLELFREKYQNKPTPIFTKPIKQKEVISPDDTLIPINELPDTSYPKQYLTKRCIPDSVWNRFFLVKKFNLFASKINDSFTPRAKDTPRLILPYYNTDKEIIGYTCRAFGREQPKYINLRLTESEFIYGLDVLNTTQPIIAVEGPIDSLLLDNAIAVSGSTYDTPFLHQNKEQVIIVPDNDFRRNSAVCEQLKKAIIKYDFTISLLPDKWKKDVNEIIKSGIKKQEVMNHIISNRKQGASALLQLTLERRC